MIKKIFYTLLFVIIPASFVFATDFSGTRFVLNEVTDKAVYIDISNVPVGITNLFNRLFDKQSNSWVDLPGNVMTDGGYAGDIWKYSFFDGLAGFRMYPNHDYEVHFYEDEAETKQIKVFPFKTKPAPNTGGASSQFYVTALTPTLTANDFTALYRVDNAPAAKVDLYTWIGEDGKNFPTWKRDNFVVTLKPDTEMPYNFGLQFDFTTLNLVAGKVYSYVLADRTAVDGAIFFNTPGSSVRACFTITAGSVACGTSAGGGTGDSSAVSVNWGSDFLQQSPTTGSYYYAIKGSVTIPQGKNSGNMVLKLGSDPASLTTIRRYDSSMGENFNFNVEFFSGQSNPASGGVISFVPGTEYFAAVYDGTKLVSQISLGKFLESSAQLTTPVRGSCGSANNGTFPSAPTDNLCSETEAPFVDVITTPTGNYAWICTGLNGGTNANCSATKGTAGVTSGTGAAGIGSVAAEFMDQAQNDPGAADQADSAGGGNLLKNPFKSLDSFPKIIAAVFNNILLPIAIPFLAVMIMYSGFLFVMARKEGKVDGYAKAKQTLKYTLIGAALMLGCWVIANALQGTLNALLS